MSILEALEQSGEVISPAVRAAILLLEKENRELREQLRRAEVRIRDLEARLGMNSSNSSKPPSSNPPQAIRRRRSAASRRAGAANPEGGRGIRVRVETS